MVEDFFPEFEEGTQESVLLGVCLPLPLLILLLTAFALARIHLVKAILDLHRIDPGNCGAEALEFFGHFLPRTVTFLGQAAIVAPMARAEERRVEAFLHVVPPPSYQEQLAAELRARSLKERAKRRARIHRTIHRARGAIVVEGLSSRVRCDAQVQARHRPEF